MTTYTGSCMCGAVTVKVEGDPMAMLLCHCKDCRAWSASPVNGAAIWPPDKMTITDGEDQVQSYTSSEGHKRAFCRKCGGHVYHDAGPMGVVDVYASVLKDLEFKPAIHINYESTILPIKDGLPKFKDFPEELGGSGEMIEE